MTPEDDEVITARLINWGLWTRGGFPRFEATSYACLWKAYFPQRGVRITTNDLDAEHIEYIVSSLEMGARSGEITGPVAIYPLVLKLEYTEHERPRELKAEHIRRKHDIKCSERTFRYHLHRAKEAVHLLSGPIVFPYQHTLLCQKTSIELIA